MNLTLRERRWPRRYASEIFVVLIGLTLSLVETLVVDSKDVGVMIAAISLMFAATMLLMRKEIADSLGDDLDRILARIDGRWRDDALHRVQVLEEDLEGWADGRRPLGRNERIQHQLDLLDRAQSEVLAVHVATDREKLAIWDSEATRFSDLVEKYGMLKVARKRRVLVLNDTIDGLIERDVGGQIRLVDDLAIRVCRRQVTDTASGGMGFELRIRWFSDGDLPRDVVIVDNREAVVVDVGMVSSEYDAEAVVSPTRLSSERKLFETTWTLAQPASSYLPDVPTAAAK